MRQEWMAAIAPHASYVGFALTRDMSKKSKIRGLQLEVVQAKQFGAKNNLPYCIISLDRCARGCGAVIQPCAERRWRARRHGPPRTRRCSGARTSPLSLPAAPRRPAFSVRRNLAFDVESVTLELFNHGLMRDAKLGEVVVALSSLPANTSIDNWMNLAGAGSVRVKITRIEESVLPLKEYQSFAQLIMHNDLEVASLLLEANRVRPLRLQAVTDRPQKHINEISRSILNVFMAQNKEVEFLSNAAALALKAEEQSSTLFRGNSLASKALDHVCNRGCSSTLRWPLQYMKAVAIPYLQASIGDAIKQIFEDKHSFEV